MEASTKANVGAALESLLPTKKFPAEAVAAHKLDDVDSVMVLPITSPEMYEVYATAVLLTT